MAVSNTVNMHLYAAVWRVGFSVLLYLLIYFGGPLAKSDPRSVELDQIVSAQIVEPLNLTKGATAADASVMLSGVISTLSTVPEMRSIVSTHTPSQIYLGALQNAQLALQQAQTFAEQETALNLLDRTLWQTATVSSEGEISIGSNFPSEIENVGDDTFELIMIRILLGLAVLVFLASIFLPPRFIPYFR